MLNYARAKQYITEEELTACQAPGAEVKQVLGSNERYVEVFSKATVDVVMSIEVPARRAKAAEAEPTSEVEMTIWLKDFPQTLEEYKALYALKQGVNGVFLVEEKFLPEEADDYSLTSMGAAGQTEQAEEEARRAEEKARSEFTAKERVALLRTALELPRLLRSGALGAEADTLLTVQRLKFKPSFDRPATPPAGEPPAEPDAAYEASLETQRGEDASIGDFAQSLREAIEQTGRDLQEYRALRRSAKPGRPLWPYREDDPELLRLREEEERRRREEEDAVKRREEEERKLAEAQAEQAKAAAGGKGAKGGPPAKPTTTPPPTTEAAP